ncbi:MAG: hypothetical protein ACE141_07710 [Bryobacteraceae bacterium]
MALSEKWVPMRWASGPLEIARRGQVKPPTAEVVEVLRKWHDPASLALVQGTPVNCLVLSWAAGLPADAEQQQTLRPLLERGRQTGVGFVGLIEKGADGKTAIAAARAAGLSAVAMEGDQPQSPELPVIPWTTSERAEWKKPGEVLALTDSAWPCLPADRPPTGGPTALPWVQSNGALIRIARALAPSRTIWLSFSPPADERLLDADGYSLAVADAAVYGARWVIALDDGLIRGLLAADQKATTTWTRIAAATWQRITSTTAFFEQQVDTRTYRPRAVFAVISDFAGPNRPLSYEAVNLLPRRRVPALVMDTSQAAGESFTGLLGVFYADQEPPPSRLRQKLVSFAQAGGTVFACPKAGFSEGSPMPSEDYFVFSMRSFGKGRIGVLKEEQPDAYHLVVDIQTIMSRRNDLMRLNNGTGLNCYYLVSPDGKRSLVHILSYSRRPGMSAGLYLKDKVRSARYLSPEKAAPAELQTILVENGGTDIPLPAIASYGAIELQS